ncbi:NAD-dependent malic enzyme, partial [Bacillus altitudinis]|nr:NAD-dependent malic enzyme [Bacillus altitudinis]
TNIDVFHYSMPGKAMLTVDVIVIALMICGKSMSSFILCSNGAGAAVIAIIKIIYHFGVRDIIMCYTKGAIYEGLPN